MVGIVILNKNSLGILWNPNSDVPYVTELQYGLKNNANRGWLFVGEYRIE